MDIEELHAVECCSLPGSGACGRWGMWWVWLVVGGVCGSDRDMAEHILVGGAYSRWGMW